MILFHYFDIWKSVDGEYISLQTITILVCVCFFSHCVIFIFFSVVLFVFGFHYILATVEAILMELVFASVTNKAL